MEQRLGEMRKGRRERMRKGAIVSSSPQGMTNWSSSIKNCFIFKLIECIIKMSWCETKICAIGEQKIECNKLKSLS